MSNRASIAATLLALFGCATEVEGPVASSSAALTLPGTLSTADKQALLDRHNLHRSNIAQGMVAGQPSATDMNMLLWDPALAAAASDHAAACVFEHNSDRTTDFNGYRAIVTFTPPGGASTYVGENIAYATGTTTLAQLLGMVDNWYSEVSGYTYSPADGTAGHYTQIVWANTRYVGCGFYRCPNLGLGSGATFLVCNYSAGGNYRGQYPYESGPTCSSCDADRTRCVDGLCAGCVASSWYADMSTTANNCDNGLGVDLSAPAVMDAGPMDAGPMDAGPMDAGPMDAGPTDEDAGPADAGPAAEDAGPTEPDMSVPGADAGPAELDLGAPIVDAGDPAGDDAGVTGPPADSGTGGGDDGSDAGDDGGCSVAASGRPVGLLAWIALGLVAYRRRR